MTAVSSTRCRGGTRGRPASLIVDSIGVPLWSWKYAARKGTNSDSCFLASVSMYGSNADCRPQIFASTCREHDTATLLVVGALVKLKASSVMNLSLPVVCTVGTDTILYATGPSIADSDDAEDANVGVESARNGSGIWLPCASVQVTVCDSVTDRSEPASVDGSFPHQAA